jgi:hypothetical protein
MSGSPWWKNFEKTNDFMSNHRSLVRIQPSKGKSTKRVKVAILDTGYDSEDPLFKEARQDHLGEIEWKDFVGNSSKPVDESGHGTRVAFFLMLVTSNVDLWIARVYQGEEGTAESAERVKKVRLKNRTRPVLT